MSPNAAFGAGLAVGAIGITFVYISLAPVLAERATYEAIVAGGGALGVPGASAVFQGLALPVSRRVRAIVAQRVSPWVRA